MRDDDIEEMKRERALYVMKRRKHIARQVDDKLLDYLKERFETELPCFQGEAGKFDPLDAMRRDAYREVVLFLEHERKLARESAGTE